MSSDSFDVVWKTLAERSICDGFNGAEYRRVYSEWEEFGKPTPIDRFITWRSNIGPNDGELTQERVNNHMDPPQQKEYTLPSMLSVALMTKRGELARNFANHQLKEEYELTPEIVADMARLIGDLIDENYELYQKLYEAKADATEIESKLNSILNTAKRTVVHAQRIQESYNQEAKKRGHTAADERLLKEEK
ncbi:MAG: hypothetical protein ACXABY_25635 [Candidatus Thorarchaeota archaeon]|jgi:hypothetical protein